MNFEFSDVWIIAAVVGIAVVGFAVYIYRYNKGKESKVSGRQFLGIGIIWVLMGLGYSLWRGENPFDIGFFNLGLIFSVAGIFQMVMERFKKKGL